MSKLKQPIYLLQYAVAALFAVPFCLLPITPLSWIAKRLGDILFIVLPKRKALALQNITRAFGTSVSEKKKNQIARKSFQNMTLAAVELLVVARIAKNFNKHFTVKGSEHWENAVKKNKGIICAVAHFGSWEYLSFIPSVFQFPTSVVVKVIRNPYINKTINDLRKIMKIQPILKDSAARPMLLALKNKEALGVLLDQWDGPTGVWVDFFGEPTSTTSIPAKMKKRTDCAILPMSCMRKGPGKYEIEVRREIPLVGDETNWEVETTRALNQSLEEIILKDPGQWLWAHRRWKPRPNR